LEHNLLKIKSLAQLTSVPLEIGNITHKLLKTLLDRLKRSSEPIDRERFFDYARREAQSIFKSKHFEDVYYGKCESIDFEKEIFVEVQRALENFLASDRLQWLFEEALVY